MKPYLTITTLLLVGLYGLGYVWPDSEEYIAAKCRASDGDYAVMINNSRFICWERGE